jgi:hypothetical protein
MSYYAKILDDSMVARRQSCANHKRRTIEGLLNWSLVIRGAAIAEAMEQGRSRNVSFGKRRLSTAGGRLHPQPIKG